MNSDRVISDLIISHLYLTASPCVIYYIKGKNPMQVQWGLFCENKEKVY